MLHKTKSRRTALLKYGLTAPLFAAMLVFSSATVIQENVDKLESAKIVTQSGTLQSIRTTNTSPVIFLNEIKEAMADQLNAASTKGMTADTSPVKSTDAAFTSLHRQIEESMKLLISSTPEEQNPRDTSTLLKAASIEIMPEYPGGISKFYQWIGDNYKFPKAATEAEISGRLIMQFVVEKDGELTDIQILRDLGFGTGEAAKELLAISPKWKPGIQNGKPVRVQYTLPLMLRTPKKSVNSADSLLIRTDKGNILDSPNPPLFILDGKEITAEQIKQIKPADIEAMQVLKDKTATDKYGEKGKNGVVIITLKKK